MAYEFEQALDALLDSDVALTRELISSFSHPVRQQAAAFAARLEQLDDDRRRELVACMVGASEASFDLDFVDLLRPLLHDKDPIIRRLAVEGLWESERADLVDELLGCFTSDSHTEVRAAAATALGRFIFLAECEELDAARAKRIRAALEEAILGAEPDLEVVRRAVEAISFITDDAVRAIIDQTYAHESELMRQSAIFAMGRGGDPRWADIILAELHSDRTALRYEAARACGEMQLRDAVASLINMATDRDRELQDMAIWALGQIGGRQAHEALEDWAGGDDDVMADAAEDALDEIDFSDLRFNLMQYDLDDLDVNEDALLELGLVDRDDDKEGREQAGKDDKGDWPDEFLEIG